MSVTQSFNMATSMGRLILNVLLSFAPFEREVTAERIRDKSPSLREQKPRKTSPSPLIGKLFDQNGECLSPSHSEKQGKRYRFYISRGYVTGRKDSLKGRGWRLLGA